MNAYEEKQEARKNYYEEMAAKKRQESSALYNSAHEMAQAIPFGQPILVGHHSEGRDRNYRNRISNKFEKSFAASDTAKYYEQKAASVGKGGISSDDPDAIDKLQEKLAGLEESQRIMVAANKLIRKGDRAGLAALGFTEAQSQKLFEGNHFGQPGFPSYRLTNNNAEIRRLKERIAHLEKVQNAAPVEVEHEGYTYREEDGRCQFEFPGKPSEEIREVLKANSFKWSPSRGTWVRQLTGNGKLAAQRVIEKLKAVQ